jgi:hypothetical protein
MINGYAIDCFLPKTCHIDRKRRATEDRVLVKIPFHSGRVMLCWNLAI